MGKIFKLMIVGAVILAPCLTQAQWPVYADTNMVICNNSGYETAPVIAAANDGGCYISWWDNTSGMFNLYLQRLGPDGQIQWQPGGLLISNHNQEAWLTKYGLIVDSQNHAILAINDCRNGNDFDVYAYRISPAGEFVWGPDGLVISDDNVMDLTPFATLTNDGNILIAWTPSINDYNTVKIRKLDLLGNDLWSPAVFSMEMTYSLTIPRIVASGADGFIVQALVSQDPTFYGPKLLTAFKFDASHNPVWGDTGVVISSAGGFEWFMKPFLVSDGQEGAYSYWYDGRNDEAHVYVQHLASNGDRLWTENGVRTSLIPDQHQFEPIMVCQPATGEVMLFYLSTNWTQTLVGISGQKIGATGQRLWGDDGITFAPLDNPSRMMLQGQAFGGGAIISYLEVADPDRIHLHARAIRINSSGEMVWGASPLYVSSVFSPKSYFEACHNSLGQLIMVWNDERAGSPGDLYLQNINPDGSLGAYQTSVDDDGPAMPAGCHLAQNYPNPFNAETVIEYALLRAMPVTVEVFDLTGRRVEVVDEGMRPAGHHRVTWNASQVPSGVYFYRIETDEFSESRRMILLK